MQKVAFMKEVTVKSIYLENDFSKIIFKVIKTRFCFILIF